MSSGFTPQVELSRSESLEWRHVCQKSRLSGVRSAQESQHKIVAGWKLKF